MTDRELIQKAAKVAGYTLDEDLDRTDVRDNGGGPLRWDPLTDDGDALRLAVKLGIQVCWHRSLGYATAHYDYGSCRREEYGDEPCAATRRAIVRAAAAMAE